MEYLDAPHRGFYPPYPKKEPRGNMQDYKQGDKAGTWLQPPTEFSRGPSSPGQPAQSRFHYRPFLSLQSLAQLLSSLCFISNKTKQKAPERHLACFYGTADALALCVPNRERGSEAPQLPAQAVPSSALISIYRNCRSFHFLIPSTCFTLDLS